jgi:hypothetical protein
VKCLQRDGQAKSLREDEDVNEFCPGLSTAGGELAPGEIVSDPFQLVRR